MKSLTIQIPKPCHERWADMQPREQGRFCASCQKTVVDYTALSDRELARVLSQLDTACGRFRNDQLNRSLPIPAQEKTPIWRQWLGMLSMGLLSWQTAQAQHTMSLSSTVALSDQFQAIQDTTAPATNRVFSGIVTTIDTSGKERPLMQAYVSIKGTTSQTQTDNNGAFQLDVPADMATSLITVYVSSLGFVAQEIGISDVSQSRQIILREEVLFLGEVTSVSNYKASGWGPVNKTSNFHHHSFPSRWQRFKFNLFHKTDK